MGANTPGAPGQYWTSLPDFPTPVSTPWYLQPGGALATSLPPAEGPTTSASYVSDPDVIARITKEIQKDMRDVGITQPVGIGQSVGITEPVGVCVAFTESVDITESVGICVQQLVAVTEPVGLGQPVRIGVCVELTARCLSPGVFGHPAFFSEDMVV